jgi:hypothetical protein
MLRNRNRVFLCHTSLQSMQKAAVKSALISMYIEEMKRMQSEIGTGINWLERQNNGCMQANEIGDE